MSEPRYTMPRDDPRQYNGHRHLTLSVTQVGDLVWEAAREHPHEACGFIYKGVVIPVANVAKDPSHWFEMDSDEMLRLYSLHGRPEAIWHSHPSAITVPEPSELDRQQAPKGIPYIIIGAGRIGVWKF